ncbi:MAG TPA: hypothetical protein VKV30_10030 [Candidatus Angelobacter sp.]|nr:hypothetical protein [Candidatus Angelobacter sp.]
MAHEEAAFSRKHSAVSENQQQNQRPFTAEPLHGADAQDAEESGTLPLRHDKPGQTNVDEQERVKQRAEALVRRIGETCDELDKLAEENPELVGRVTRSTEEHKDAYLRLKARLTLADMAPRCQWVRQDGTSCGSPQMKQHIYCFAHMQMAEARTLMLMLPVAEDANAIQIGLMQIQKALIEDRISMKKAGLLLYSMQLALTNVGQTTFGKAKDEEMVRETVDEEEAFSRQRSTLSEKQHQHQKPFTTEGTEDAEEIGASGYLHIGTSETKNLPRMGEDDRGLKNPKPIVWKPTPDMYRMDTPEGRAAYEASFGKKIEGQRSSRVWPASSHQKIVLKPTPIWDDLGCGGTPREGEGASGDLNLTTDQQR